MENRASVSKFKRGIYIIVPIAVLFALIGWRMSIKRSELAASMSQHSGRGKTPSVAVAPVQLRDIVQTFETTGNIEAPLDVNIAPKITGRVDYLQVSEGDKVRKGQVLIKIDPSQVEAEVGQQKAAVAEAKYRLAQAQLTQNATNMGVSTQIRQQKAAAASAAADYDQAQKNNDAQLASASASISDCEGKIAVADAAIENAQASITSAQANLDNARTKYNRMLELYNKGYVAAKDQDDAKAILTTSEAALTVARGQLKSANAQHDSALAQKRVAEQQASIIKSKGKADIEAAKAKLIQANASVDYAQANTSQEAAYQQSIAALQSAVDAAKAGLRSSEAKRSDTVLVSPMDGYITGRNVDPGAVVTAGQSVISVKFMKQIWVTIAVPEEVVSKLHFGQPAKIILDAFKGRSFTGNIVQINPSADTQSRQFTVRIGMDNAKNLFKPGMFAHVSIEIEHIKDTLSVPREAVQRDRLGEYVMAINQGKVERREITVGASDAGFIGILRGVSLGEKVVTMTSFPLKDG